MIPRARAIASCCLALAFFVRPGTAAVPDPAHCIVFLNDVPGTVCP